MDRATIVGTPTYGKGAAQRYAVFPQAGYELGMTDYYFVRRNGMMFHGVPFVPKMTLQDWLNAQMPMVQSLRSVVPHVLSIQGITAQ